MLSMLQGAEAELRSACVEGRCGNTCTAVTVDAVRMWTHSFPEYAQLTQARWNGANLLHGGTAPWLGQLPGGPDDPDGEVDEAHHHPHQHEQPEDDGAHQLHGNRQHLGAFGDRAGFTLWVDMSAQARPMVPVRHGMVEVGAALPSHRHAPFVLENSSLKRPE